MSRIGIIGGGAFGTAMACVVRRCGHEIVMWAREPEVVAAINNERVNSLFLQGVPLVPGIRATNELSDAIVDCQFVLMAVPAQHLRSVAAEMKEWVRPAMAIVSCSKGVERGSCAFMPEVISATLPHAQVAVLSGPSFAREIAAGLPCGVVLACANVGLRDYLSRTLANARFCVHGTDDVIGAAIGGVMKNVVSIASGIAAGRRLGENARSTLVTLGLAETIRLGLAKGARQETFVGLAGIGDMMLTANSLQSRNTSLGVALGEGRKLKDVLASRKEVTEGVASVAPLVALAQHLGIDMPITQTLDDLLNQGASVDEAIDRIVARFAHRGAA